MDTDNINQVFEKQQIAAIDGRECEKKWIESERDPGHLTRFLKKYPAAFYLSWVKDEFARWGASGEFDNLKKLQPGRGCRKNDTGLRQVFTDFLIYQKVLELRKQGLLLKDNSKGHGVFQALDRQKIGDTALSDSQIRERYYRFINHRAVTFIDNGKKIIFGPGLLSFEVDGKKISMIGFTEYEPKDGFELIKPE